MAYRAAAVPASNAWCCSAAECLDREAAGHPLGVQLHHRPSEPSAVSCGGVCGRQRAGDQPGVPSARQCSCGAMPHHLSQGRRLEPQGCPALPSKLSTRRPTRTWGNGSWVHYTQSFAWLGSGGMGAHLLLQCPHGADRPLQLGFDGLSAVLALESLAAAKAGYEVLLCCRPTPLTPSCSATG